MRATHSQRLERWLGPEKVEHMSRAMRGWYGPPIAVAGVPGNVWACGDGDFRGRIDAGKFPAALDYLEQRLKSAARNFYRKQSRKASTGFASLSDLIAEATAGKRRELFFQKVDATGVVAATNTMWRVGNQPVAGSNGAAAPGGTAFSSASTGAIPFDNPTGGDTQHIVSAVAMGSAAGNLMLYDRLFGVAKTMNSTATQAVTGVPTRYQSTTAGAQDSAEGNFLFVETVTALAATAHNWTVCQYTDQGGTTTVSLPSLTGNASNIIHRLDHPVGQWFAPLATDDTGILALTQMQCSAAVATGAIEFVIGHPLAWIPVPFVNLFCQSDFIYSAFNLTRIFDDACLAFLNVIKPATAGVTFNGSLTTVRG
jgi:hypothetical protein